MTSFVRVQSDNSDIFRKEGGNFNLMLILWLYAAFTQNGWENSSKHMAELRDTLYWLTEAEGRGLPIPDKVHMVPSRLKSKVYNCFIKLSGILLEIDFNHQKKSMALSLASKNRREMRCIYCDVIRKWTPNTPL